MKATHSILESKWKYVIFFFQFMILLEIRTRRTNTNHYDETNKTIAVSLTVAVTG